MRKAFTLVEMLVVATVLPFLFMIVDGMFRTLLKDIPHSCSVAQEHTTLLNMLDQLQRDVDRATGLPQSSGDLAAAEDLLLIELKDGTISYQLKDGQVVRRTVKEPLTGESPGLRIWDLPNATVVWKVWSKDGRGYAVATKAYIEQSIRGQWKQKMANSHLYFVGTL